MKCQFLEEKAEKEQSNLNDKVTNLETQLKDADNQISNLSSNLTTVRQSEKDLLEKIKNYDLSNISTNETLEKLKKEIKILEERLNNSELQVKNKTGDIGQLSTTK